MKQFLLSLFFVLAALSTSYSQLPSGSNAPAFTVVDIDGNTHDLYSYLNAGISVVMDVSATWCGPCWSYHNSHTLSNFYNAYGPNGSGDAMVIFVEGDSRTNLACLYGNAGCNFTPSQGNWVDGTPYPIIHDGGPGVANLYQINAFPTVFMISAGNKKSYTTGGGGVPGTTLFNWVMLSFKMAATPTVSNAVCGGDGAIALNVTAGFGNKTYLWSNGSTTKDISGLVPGTYTCTITDANNYRIETDPIVVGGVFNALDINVIERRQPSCYGNTNGLISISGLHGNGGYTYLWSNGQNTATISNIPAGQYFVTIIDAQNCTLESSVILGQPAPVASTVSAPPVPCSQTTGTVVISASGGTSPYTYNIGNGAQNSGTFPNLSPQEYNYTIIDNKGCVLQNSFTLASQPRPVAQASAAQDITCVQTQGQVSGSGSSDGSNYSYLWTTQNGNIVSGHDQLNAIVDEAGTYTLHVTDIANACTSNASAIVVADREIPASSVADADVITCIVPEVTLQGSVQGNVAEFSFEWLTTDGNIVSGGNTLTPVVDAEGTYVLEVTKISSGCTHSSELTVAENINTPDGTYEYTLEGNQFEGNALADGTGNTYAWDFGNGEESTEQNPSVEFDVEGTYEVCLTVTNECGSHTTCQTVIYSGVLTSVVESTNLTCHGANNGSAVAYVGGGLPPYTYEWTGPDGFSSNNESISNLSAGVYNLVITDAQNTVLNQTVTITQPAPVTVNNVTITNDSHNQGLGSIVISVEGGTGALSYLWSNGQSSSTINGLTAGEYLCTVTDGNGCSNVFGPYRVENASGANDYKFVSAFDVTPNPASSFLNIDLTLIKDQPITLNVSNQVGKLIYSKGYNGNISDKLDVSALPSGMYFVSVKGDAFIVSRKVVVIK